MAPPYPAPPNPPEEEDDDDYMTMTFSEPTPTETTFQRTQRLKREALVRGQVKSKAQLAHEEQAKREAALSRSLLDDPASMRSKGLAMMAKMGFRGGALGKGGGEGAVTEPIAVKVKEDRAGIGLDEERRKRAREVEEELVREGKRAKKVEPGEYRDRVRREREVERLEKQVLAAMRLAEQLDEEKEPDVETVTEATKSEAVGGEDEGSKSKDKKRSVSSKLLKHVPVLYRGLIKNREVANRDRIARHTLQNSLSTRLPGYEGDSDEDDRQAMGKAETVYVEADDLDESDAELEEFEGLEVEERLRQLLEYLRREHRYCFWCKSAYPDEEMDGCPGLTEEDHD